MWQYEKKLQYPVNIKNPNPKLAKVIISQLGGLNTKKIYICDNKKGSGSKPLPFVSRLF